MSAAQSNSASELCYAGFWPRLGALVVDMLIWAPIGFIVMKLYSHSRVAEIYTAPALILFSLWYSMYLVYRYGGTPGKLALRLRVVRSDGSPVALRNAVLRELVGYLLDIAMRIGAILVLLRISDSEYAAVVAPHARRYEVLARFSAPWIGWASIASRAWVWSELLVMLTNRRRRALHDFIAGTVVVRLHHGPSTAVEPDIQQAMPTPSDSNA